MDKEFENLKPTIILLHGAIGAKDQLEPLRESLSGNFNVFSFSFYGHGSDPGIDRKFSIDEFANQLENFIIENGLSSPAIFGYSMGGYVALYLASKKPDLIGSVFTYGTKFNWDPETSLKESRMLDPVKIEEKIPAFAAQLKQRHSTDWKIVLERTKEMMMALGSNPVIEKETLEKINIPVLITWGGLDNMVSKQESQWAGAIIPKGDFHVFENFPHPIEKVDEKVLVSKIREFIDHCCPGKNQISFTSTF